MRYRSTYCPILAKGIRKKGSLFFGKNGKLILIKNNLVLKDLDSELDYITIWTRLY